MPQYESEKELAMSSADQLLALKQKIDRMRTARDKAQGSLDSLLKTLKSEFDCDSLKEGRELLATIEEDAKIAEEAFQTALKDFNEEWGEKLST